MNLSMRQMLANGDGPEREPRRTRTFNLLIKSLFASVPDCVIEAK